MFVGSGELTKAEVPITFTVALEGQAQAEPTPTPSPTPSPTPTPAAVPPEPEAQDSTPAAAAVAGVGGLLAGVVGAIVLPPPSAATLTGGDPLAGVRADRGRTGHGDEYEPRPFGSRAVVVSANSDRDPGRAGDCGGVAGGRGR